MHNNWDFSLLGGITFSTMSSFHLAQYPCKDTVCVSLGLAWCYHDLLCRAHIATVSPGAIVLHSLGVGAFFFVLSSKMKLCLKS